MAYTVPAATVTVNHSNLAGVHMPLCSCLATKHCGLAMQPSHGDAVHYTTDSSPYTAIHFHARNFFFLFSTASFSLLHCFLLLYSAHNLRRHHLASRTLRFELTAFTLEQKFPGTLLACRPCLQTPNFQMRQPLVALVILTTTAKLSGLPSLSWPPWAYTCPCALPVLIRGGNRSSFPCRVRLS